MKVDGDMCMKKRGTGTKCPVRKQAYYMKMCHLNSVPQEWVGLIDRKCNNDSILREIRGSGNDTDRKFIREPDRWTSMRLAKLLRTEGVDDSIPPAWEPRGQISSPDPHRMQTMPRWRGYEG